MFDVTNLSSITKELCKQSETIILDQLNEFVSRGLIVIESTEPILTRDMYSDKITLQQKIRLVLKDQEYIKKLEKENTQLKQQIEGFYKIIRESFPEQEDDY